MYCSMSDEPVPYNVFKDILTKFNVDIMEKSILKGDTFKMGRLSSLYICRMKRDPRSLVVNWAASFEEKRKLEEEGIPLYDKETGEGEQWIVYYTDSMYFRWRWAKSQCNVKNQSVYRFDPTRGEKGNKGKLMEVLKNDDLAYLNFQEYEEYGQKYK